MKIVETGKLIGKMITYENGMQMMLMSGGIGNHTTFVFKRETSESEWVVMSMQEAMPLILDIARQVLSGLDTL